MDLEVFEKFLYSTLHTLAFHIQRPEGHLYPKNSLRSREKQSQLDVIARVGSPAAEFPMDSSDFSIVSPPFMTDDGSRRRSEDHPVGTAPRLPESFYTWASRQGSWTLLRGSLPAGIVGGFKKLSLEFVSARPLYRYTNLSTKRTTNRDRPEREELETDRSSFIFLSLSDAGNIV